jgi:hypothetical protein
MLGRRLGAVFVAVLISCFAMPALASARCKEFKHRAKVESDPFGADLFYLNITQWVCFNGQRITKVRDLEVEPQHVGITGGTMSYRNLRTTEEYRVWKNRSHGSYYVRASALVTQSFWGPIPSKNQDIWVSMRIYGNGNVNRDRKNG